MRTFLSSFSCLPKLLLLLKLLISALISNRRQLRAFDCSPKSLLFSFWTGKWKSLSGSVSLHFRWLQSQLSSDFFSACLRRPSFHSQLLITKFFLGKCLFVAAHLISTVCSNQKPVPRWCTTDSMWWAMPYLQAWMLWVIFPSRKDGQKVVWRGIRAPWAAPWVIILHLGLRNISLWLNRLWGLEVSVQVVLWSFSWCSSLS